MRAFLFLFALLLLPGVALAHGDHAPVPAQQRETAPVASRSPTDHALSPVCPTPTHACACGNLALCDSTSRPFLQLPLYQHVKGVQLTADWAFVTGLSVRF